MPDLSPTLRAGACTDDEVAFIEPATRSKTFSLMAGEDTCHPQGIGSMDAGDRRGGDRGRWSSRSSRWRESTRRLRLAARDDGLANRGSDAADT